MGIKVVKVIHGVTNLSDSFPSLTFDYMIDIWKIYGTNHILEMVFNERSNST